MAHPTSAMPEPILTKFCGTTKPAVTRRPATAAIDAACPRAIGSSETKTTVRLRRCSPRATANSQPMAGFRPWKAPSPASTSGGHASVMPGRCPMGADRTLGFDPSEVARRSRVAVGVGRAVAALEPHLVWTVRLRPLHEELLVEGDTTILLGVELDHPAVDAVGIELRVNGAVERVGEVDASAVPADLNHLRAAAECAVLGAGMRGPGDDAADPHLAGELGVERVGDVILLQIAGAPARYVEVPRSE